ncbi:helix-turn-helix transcriptional regulator [Thermoanaerobacter sp. YS13]|uniref:helix-turn-helix transcriptional regulator n=1 Tax=Thermoanaerobacter sp. YS13 TaxID=1511746 RepID=UPI000691540E|nr:helix-turn-helix transcriptional regulator [Thermoanaerobacter sp. YS13]
MKRDLLRMLRRGRTQREIAEELGISQQYLSAIETGVRTPNVRLMKKFEEYFNTPMETLFPDVFMRINTTKRDIKRKEVS